MIYNNTEVIRESSRGYDSISLETILLDERKIFLSGKTDMKMADDFVRQMMYLEKQSSEDINIYINGPGGDVEAGLLIYDVMQSAESTINTYCMGMAYSMAAFLLAAGDVGHRFILPHSTVMIHEPYISSSIGGNASTIRNLADSILDTKKTSIDILVKHTGKTRKEIEKAISYDNYMSANEAVAFGICDKIVERII